MTKLKYTKEFLEPLVKDSYSFREVVGRLGVSINSGGMNSHIKRQTVKYGIDTSHFLGRGRNRGENHVGGPDKKNVKDILLLRAGQYRTKATQLRRALLEIGREYKCYLCEVSKWRGKQLTLPVEHKNGNPLDDRKENIEFICPNCHSLTKTFGNNKRH